MRSCTLLCAAALLAACATPAEPPALPPPTKFYVQLDDFYRLAVEVDTEHDTAVCEPVVPVTARQVPWFNTFAYYPCTGLPFSRKMVGVKAAAEAAGKQFKVYQGVRIGEKRYGYVVAVYVPQPARGYVYPDR